jgi:predicted regulator of Ras-like GTPase activity (Roadblock/LC7/MglB family)
MALQGNLRDMSVADMIQVNCQEKKLARATIRSNNRVAILFFRDGAVVHAVLDDLIGEEVIYAILNWDDGDFLIDLDVVSDQVTIKRNWSGLLLEGAKRLDETQPDSGLELDFGDASGDQKQALISGLLQKFMDSAQSMDALAVVGMDGYIKYSIAKNSIDENIAGAIAAATYNLGKRNLGLLRMDQFQRGLFGGEKNTLLVCLINRYSLLLGIYSAPASAIHIDWNTVDLLITDLGTLL